MCASVMKLIFN